MKDFLRRRIIIALIILFAFAFISWQGWLSVPKNIFYNLTSSAQKTVYPVSVKMSGFFEFFKSLSSLKEHNKKLKKKKKDLLIEISNLKQKAKENEFLRAQLSLEEPVSGNLVLASVFGKVSSGYGDCIFIDKGKKDGLSEGLAVITSGNIIIGKLIEVADSFSKVELIISPNSKIYASIQDSGLEGLIKGKKGGGLIMDLLPPDSKIKKDETIISSGSAGGFPPNFLIGKISKIISFESNASKKAQVEPLADFSKLKKVFVITHNR